MPAHAEGRVNAALGALFLASGCAALIYEVIWIHLLRLVIGSSALSLAILLATFMGGMFLGSVLLPRVVPGETHPLRVYGALEVGIGLFGLFLPVALPAVRSVYFAWFGYGILDISLRGLAAAVLILPPTALMGATLPAIARRYRRGPGGASRIGLLYGANTAGAVLGCGLTGFYLLPRWDVETATGVAAALNFVVGGTALWLARRASRRAPHAERGPAEEVLRAGPRIGIVYLVTGLSGMTALGSQVVWTRLLALLFGGTTYTFAIILAVFLAGLAIGSAWAASLLRRGRSSVELLARCQLLLAPALLYAAFVIARLIPYAAPLRFTPIGIVHALHLLRCLEAALPATLLWGMSFPLALAAAAQDDTGRSTGNVYAANTLGAVAGALGVGLFAIPRWGTQCSQRLLAAASGVAALAACLVLLGGAAGHPDRRSRASRRAALLAPTAVAVAIAAAALMPALPSQFQAIGRYIWRFQPRALFPYVEEGVTSTVAVRLTPDGTRHFHVAGKVEASTAPADMRLQRLLGHLSALVHPSPGSVLVVGLGAGVTAGSFVVHPEVRRIVICEIEPRVVGAASGYFSEANHAVLSDPRVEVIEDDARHFLATTREKFDVITSDPIHPWVRGNSILFSREYYEIVKQRLNPGGVATQWVPLYETSAEAVKIQMRTFFDAFPGGTVWNSRAGGAGYDVVLLGQAEPTRIALDGVQERIDRNPRLQASLAEVGLGTAVDLLASYATRAADLGEWLEGTPVNRDLSLKLEYLSGLALNLQLANRIYASMAASRRYPHDLFAATPEEHAQLRQRILRPFSPAAAP
jgi:spermidine synthase